MVVLLEEGVIVLGEIMAVLFEKKFPNVRLTFHMRQHGKLLPVSCACDATVS